MKAKALIYITSFLSAVTNIYGYINDQYVFLSGSSTFASSIENNVTFFWQPSKHAFRAGRVPSGSNNFKDSLIGNYSFGFGYNVKASSSYTFAFGDRAEATGFYSVILASPHWDYYRIPVASGYGSVALGQSVVASGNNSVSLGLYTTSSGVNSTALGFLTTSSGESSFAAGSSSQALYLHSTAIGYSNYAAANGTFVAGWNNDAFYSYGGAMGFESQSLAENAYAVGYRVIAKSQDAFVIGRYNNPLSSGENSSASDRVLFAVGNGTGPGLPDRSNAFVVRANGVIEGNGSGLTGLANGQIVNSGTNVGIGRTPAVKLDVNGVVAVGANSTIISGSEIGRFAFYSRDNSSGASGSRGHIQLVNDSGATWNGTPANEDTAMEFWTARDRGSYLAMHLDSNGRMGIGTNDPKEAFQIGNSIAFHNGGNKALSFNTYWSPEGWRNMQNGYAGFIYFMPHAEYEGYGDLHLGISSGSADANEVNNPGNVMTLKPNGDVHVNNGNLYAKVPERGGISMGQFTGN